MKPNKLGLVGRCFLAGGLAVAGCDSSGNLYPSSQMAVGGVAAQHVATTNPNLTPNQVQGFGALGSLLGMVAQQEAMKEAARQGRSEVNVYGGNSNKDVIYLKDGGIIEGEIYDQHFHDDYIRIYVNHGTRFIQRRLVKSYIDR